LIYLCGKIVDGMVVPEEPPTTTSNTVGEDSDSGEKDANSKDEL